MYALTLGIQQVNDQTKKNLCLQGILIVENLSQKSDTVIKKQFKQLEFPKLYLQHIKKSLLQVH